MNLDKALQYYIEYESHNRLNKIGVPSDGISIDKASLSDTNKLDKLILEKKKKVIIDILKFEVKPLKDDMRIKFFDSIIELSNEESTTIKVKIDDLMESYKLKKNKSTDDRISRIIALIKKDEFVVLSPIMKSGKKSIHLIAYVCHIVDVALEIKEFRVNRDALDKLMLLEVGYGLDEKLGSQNDVNDYFEALHQLTFANFDEAEKALVKSIKEDFQVIKKKIENDFSDIVVISIEGLDSTYYPPFKEDMQLLKTKDDISPSSNLSKYLLHNDESRHADNLKLSSHRGSYTKEYPVNKKQWKVISACEQADILAVSGPPGTGKTTLLKELVADLSVKKACRLIEVWDEEWTQKNYNGKGLFISPFEGNNDESIIVTSTNNEAVNNVGAEITKDIKLLKKKLGLELCADFSAKLGNSENKKQFFNNNLDNLMKQLSEELEERDVSQEIETFNALLKKLDEINVQVTEFLFKYDQMEQLELIVLNENVLNEHDFLNAKEKFNIEINEIKSGIIKVENEKDIIMKRISMLLDDMAYSKKALRDISTKVKDNEIEIEKVIAKQEKTFNKIIIGLLNKLGVPGQKIKIGLYNDIESMTSNLATLKQEQTNQDENISNKNIEYQSMEESKKDFLKDIENKQIDLKEHQAKAECVENFIISLEEIKETFGSEIVEKFDNIQYHLYNHKNVLDIRYQLFELSLIIQEVYITKHKQSINNNLNYFMKSNGSIISEFYRGNYKYDESTKSAIKQIWETLCLCFPVVTTTLHSFSKDNIHLIKELFDYMLVDEAGQILPYYLLAPLYRTRKTIVVGDEKQLEPIRDSNNKVFEKYVGQISDELNANNATAQGLASLASDYFEENKSSGHIQIEGIMLEEHRRCEYSIAQFSNDYVYDGRMEVVKKDVSKPYLEDNLCFVDIRGIKSNKHVNTSEVNAISKLIEQLLNFYKAEDIAVIAPYKNQVNALKSKIENKSVQVGTVHSFQGKDKEIVVVSLTIDSEYDNSAKRFIGDKPNMLNVAFTRAKQQVLIVGNYSVLEKTENTNYLHKTYEFIKKHGTLFSIYDSDSLEKLTEIQYQQFMNFIQQLNPQESDKFYQIFKPYLNEVNMIENDQHYPLLKSLFATSEQSITVVSPWFTKHVLSDEFIESIESFNLKNRYAIVFGYMNSKDTLETDEEIKKIIKRDNRYVKAGDLDTEVERIKNLKRILGINLIYQPPLHTKALIVDDEFLLIGSHNWLSKKGEIKGSREEMTVVITDKGMIDYINKKFNIN